MFYDEKEQVLIGEYSDAIHKYRYLIYCNIQFEYISKKEQDKILKKLQNIQKDKNNLDNNIYEAKYFYFILNGIF